jgi:hypothetical protein
MRIFPNQRLESSKKDKQWKIDCVDAISMRASQYTEDWERMRANYAMKNSQTDTKEYRAICQGLGVTGEDAAKYVEMYNIVANIVETFLGEESSRPFTYNVINNNPEDSNEIQRQQDREFQTYMLDVFNHELKRSEALYKAKLAAIEQGLSKNESEKELQRIQEQFAELENRIFDPKKIAAKYKSKFTTKELMMKKIMRAVVERQNIKWIKNATFEDAIVAGIEVVDIVHDNKYDLPRIKQVPVMEFYYHKAPNTQFIHEAEYAGYREYMTIGDVVQKFDLEEEDVALLQSRQLGGIYGTKQTMTNGYNASSPDALMKSGMYPSQNVWRPDGENPVGTPYGSNSTILSPGMYANTNNNMNSNYCTVHTVYWRSQRKLYVHKFKNEYGEEDYEFLSEEWQAPEGAKFKSIRENEFGKAVKQWFWLDEATGFMETAEPLWVPEIWRGYKINNAIYCNIEPIEHGYKSMLNPFKANLPVYGLIYNNRNAYTLSPMDKMRPWQKLYYVVMAKLVKTLYKDHGVLTFLNMAFIDKKLGLERTLELAEETGIIPFNPLEHSQGINATFLNTFKAAEKVDVQNSSSVEYYISLLRFIEEKLMMATGMSPQRLAQTQSYTNASDNQRETAHSMNMTEKFYSGHDLLWQEIMNGLMQAVYSTLRDNPGNKIIRDMLDDNEIALLKAENLSIYDDFRLRIGNDAKAYRTLQALQSNAQALIQNGVPMSELVNLMRKEDLVEFQQNLKEFEELTRMEKVEEQKRKEAIEQERIKAMRAMSEDEQIALLDNTFLKGKLSQEQEKIRGEFLVQSYNMGTDVNENKIPDYMEFDLKAKDLVKRAEQKDRELDLKERDQLLKEQQIVVQQMLEDNKRAAEREAKAADRVHESTLEEKRLKVEEQKIQAMKEAKLAAARRPTKK